MADNIGMHLEERILTAERRFEGSIFDVAMARHFARVTAMWWGIRSEPLECIVDELARRAVCEPDPAFTVSLSVKGSDVQVRVDGARDGADERSSTVSGSAASGH